MKLNHMGLIIENVWESLPNHHPVKLDAFQIMPNHVHFIICITCGQCHNHDDLGGTRDDGTGASRHDDLGASRRAPTLGWIIGMFKTECTKQINIINKTPGRKIFQRNYYERIIRNEEEYLKIKKYIFDNPSMWERDRNNPENIIL